MMNNTGIYMIFNEITEDFYIGSARVSFKKRHNQHRNDLKSNAHRNNILQRSFNKHRSFIFVIIEIVEGEDNILNKEQKYIDTLNPRYNLTKNVRQPSLGIKMTEIHKEKLRQLNIGRIPWNKGIAFNEEVRTKMSISKRGILPVNKGNKGTSDRKVIRDDGVIYNNIYEAAKHLGVKENTIVKSIVDKAVYRKVKGHKFLYLEDLQVEFGNPNINLYKYIHTNTDKFIVRYVDKTGKSIYAGRFNTKEEALIERDKLFKTNPPRN